jgi:hypothetical protein
MEGALVTNPVLRGVVAAVGGMVLMMVAAAALSFAGGVGTPEVLLLWALGSLVVWLLLRPRSSSRDG